MVKLAKAKLAYCNHPQINRAYPEERCKFLIDYFEESLNIKQMNLSWVYVRTSHPIIALSLFTCLLGCAPSAIDIVEEWQEKGWQIVKVHGTQGKIERHGKLMSDQAKAIEASWVEKGVRKTKLYSQSNQKILLLRFFKNDGDQFAVVMKKRK